MLGSGSQAAPDHVWTSGTVPPLSGWMGELGPRRMRQEGSGLLGLRAALDKGQSTDLGARTPCMSLALPTMPASPPHRVVEGGLLPL